MIVSMWRGGGRGEGGGVENGQAGRVLQLGRLRLQAPRLPVDGSALESSCRPSGVQLLVNGGSVVLELPHDLFQAFPHHPLYHCVHSIEVLVRVSVPLERNGGRGGGEEVGEREGGREEGQTIFKKWTLCV